MNTRKRILFVNLVCTDNNKPKHFNKVVITEGASKYKGLQIVIVDIIKHVGFTNK